VDDAKPSENLRTIACGFTLDHDGHYPDNLNFERISMLQTYEATLETSGQVLFTDLAKPVYQQRQKVSITIVSPLANNALSALPTQPADLGNAKHDWLAFAGALKNFPAFAGDRLAIQQQMRSEWRKPWPSHGAHWMPIIKLPDAIIAATAASRSLILLSMYKALNKIANP
jgi:hypothetical protein